MSDRLPVYPYPRNDSRTHWEGCWAEQGHHNCAIAEVERLTAELADCKESRRLIERLQARVGSLEGTIRRLHDVLTTTEQEDE